MIKSKQTKTQKNISSTSGYKLRGKEFVGTIVSDKPQKTVIVEWERRKMIPKYERYEKRRTRVAAHLPEEIEAKVGDKVKIVECRPISKTKNFIVTKNIGINEAKLIKDSEAESRPQKQEKEPEVKNKEEPEMEAEE